MESSSAKAEVLEHVTQHTVPDIPKMDSAGFGKEEDSSAHVPPASDHTDGGVEGVTEGMEGVSVVDLDEDVLDVKGLTEEEIQASVQKSEEVKKAGNTLFGEGKFDQAIEKYEEGLRLLPSGHSTRALLYGNKAACHMKMGNNEKAAEDCTKALAIDPVYAKALTRRAQSYEATGRLEDALDDWKKLLEVEPNNKVAKDAVLRLPPAIAEKNEKLKAEMLGKLKDIGNSLLGKFGLSLDNFKMEQRTDGSYNINFNQGGR
eukprot:comp16776_c0_seq1/m.15146 comp16776_c0_seq1/g.15146  ORF comp16776_c0_seq1/g.15146 comp16776_c0_seq1/m.15146 type:complete len:260 (-) comp16776_c0_seq1:885-1664(-)